MTVDEQLEAQVLDENTKADLTSGKEVVVAAAPREVKLDLGCGDVVREGFEGVDLYAANATYKFDLLKFPWPFEDNSVSEIHCSHFIEHIPMAYWSTGNEYDNFASEGRIDLLIKFFMECWRVLKKDAYMHVVTPSVRSSRAFQDPTHRRFIPGELYFYLSKEWRDLNKIDHYIAQGQPCNFGFEVFPALQQGLGLELRAPEVQAYKVQHEWNTTADFHAKLKAIK